MAHGGEDVVATSKGSSGELVGGRGGDRSEGRGVICGSDGGVFGSCGSPVHSVGIRELGTRGGDGTVFAVGVEIGGREGERLKCRTGGGGARGFGRESHGCWAFGSRSAHRGWFEGDSTKDVFSVEPGG